jgi:hypothetical protein
MGPRRGPLRWRERPEEPGRLEQVQLETVEGIDHAAVAAVPTSAVGPLQIARPVDVGVRMTSVVEVQIPTRIDVLVEMDPHSLTLTPNRRHVHELAGMELREVGSLPDQHGHRLERSPIRGADVVIGGEEGGPHEHP